MVRKFFCGILIALPVCYSLSGTLLRGEEAPPNILLIMADDVGCETLGCYGGSSYETPRIDRLAAEGMQFTHCYSMPVCHPTRVTLLSGRYPFRLENPKWGSYPKDEEAKSLAAAMKRAGYATAVAGKWQLTLLKRDPQHPHRMGFDEYSLFGWHEGARYHDPLVWQNGEIRADTKGQYGPDLYVEFLIDFIKRNREQKWFAFYSMALCHDVTDDLGRPVPHVPGKDRYLTYAEMMASMDLCIGRLVAAVDEMGLKKNTVVMFTTDNGTAGRSKLRAVDGKNKFEYEKVLSKFDGQLIPGGKGSLANGGTNVPLIVRWPKQIKPGSRSGELIDFTDFYTTVTDLAGQEVEGREALDSHSFAELLRGDDAFEPRQFAFAQGRNGRCWVRTQQFKLYNDGKFYDVAADPREQKPIALEKQSGDARKARKLLAEALTELNFPE